MQKKSKINIVQVILWSIFIIFTYEVILIFQTYILRMLNHSGIFSSVSANLVFSMIYQVLSYLLVFYIIRRFIFPVKVQRYQCKSQLTIYFYITILAYLLSASILSFFTYIFYVAPSESELLFETLLKEYLWYAIISALIIAPIFEELFFRYFILNYLETQLKPRYAILVSALLFGAFHLNIRQFLFASVLGVVLGIVYNKTKDIRHSIFLHFVFNLVSFLDIVILMRPIIISVTLIAVIYIIKIDFKKEKVRAERIK